MPVSQAPTEPQSDQAQRIRAQDAALRAANRNDRAAEAGRGSPAADAEAGNHGRVRPQGKAVGHHHGPPPGGTQDYTFADALDVVNPLQHIPGVSAAYQEATGDEIKPASQVTGDILFGGVPGLLAGAASAIVEESTGDDIGGHALAAAGIKEPAANPDTQLAAADGKTGEAGAREASITRTASQTKAVEMATGQSRASATPGADQRADGSQGSETGVHIAAATASGSPVRDTGPPSVAQEAAERTAKQGDDALAALAQDLRNGGQPTQTQQATAQQQAATQQANGQQRTGDIRTGDGAQSRGDARTADRAAGAEGVARGDDALSQLARDLRSGGEANTAAGADPQASANTAAARSEPGDTQTARATDAPSDADFFEIRDKHYTHAAEHNARQAEQRIEAAANTDAVPGNDLDASPAHDAGEPAPEPDRDQRRTTESRASGGEALPNPDTQGMPENFAERMKNALDKYRAMQQAQ